MTDTIKNLKKAIRTAKKAKKVVNWIASKDISLAESRTLNWFTNPTPIN